MALAVRAMVMMTKRARARAARGMTTLMKRVGAIAARGRGAVTRVLGNQEGDGEGAREGGMIHGNSFCGGKRRARSRKISCDVIPLSQNPWHGIVGEGEYSTTMY